VLLAALASSFIYPIILAMLCEPAWSEIASGFLGLLLLGAALLPVGMLVASFVKKRGAAGALTLCVLLLVLLAQAVIPGMSPWLKNILIKATPTYHMDAFISGVVGISDIVYFASVSALLLYLSVRVTNFNKRYR
jgi:ABC-2 type transport system permease protein